MVKKETEHGIEVNGAVGVGAEGRENDIVIHPTLCHMLRLKDAKLQAHSLPWVRCGSSNKVNNCFTVMHTLVLLEAKLSSCCSWYCGTLCRQGRAKKKMLQRSHSFLSKCGTQGTQPCCVLHRLFFYEKNELHG